MFFPQQKPSSRPNPHEAANSASLLLLQTHARGGAATAKNLLVAILFTALTLSPPLAHPQGCAQCLDNTAATPPATQRAYRHAILLLTLTAGGLFVTTLALFKRHR
jgi:hypothetical protein